MDAGDLQGKLLVAAPTLLDPNFARTVVLICEHTDEGAIGLVLNRPSETPVADYLPEWQEQLTPPPMVFAGGPVNPEMAVGLAAIAPGAGFPAWTRVEGEVGLFDLSQPSELNAGGVAKLRVFSGYSGWTGAQLEAEVASGDWFVVPATADDGFDSEAANLWQSVLSRQKSNLAMFAHFPADPALN